MMGLESSSSTAPPTHSHSGPSLLIRTRSFLSNGAIIGTGMIVVFMYLSFCIVIVGPWLWFTTTLGLCNFIAISALVFLVMYNQWKTFLIDPGSIPPGWTPAVSVEMLEEARVRKEINRRDFRLQARYCDKCQAFKPPRCHHCRVCNRCVLKMDHHCPWLSACVGYSNQKYYLLFLIYSFITDIILIAIYSFWIFDALVGGDEAATEINGSLVFKTVLASINLVLQVVALVLIFILLSKQLSLVSHNVSTIEVWEKRWGEQDCANSGQTYNHIYDLGMYKNLQQVFGSNVLLWPFPSQPEGDGVHFPVNGRPAVIIVDLERMQDMIEEEEKSVGEPLELEEI